jgi:hypothetical protein
VKALGNEALNAQSRVANAADIFYANDPSLRAFELAVQAGYKAQEAWEGVSKTIQEEITRLRGGGAVGQSFATLQSQFAIATAQARAGDVTALAKLPDLSKALEDASLKMSGTLDEFRRSQAFLANSLEQTIYGGNSPYTPVTQAQQYATPNLAYSGNSVSADVRGEVAGFRAESKAQQESIAITLDRLYRIMNRWEAIGVPVVNQQDTVLDTR